MITLQEAIRKLAHLPATNLGIKDRGLIKKGYFADIAIFNPEEIADRATYENPHQYAVGMEHVFINGQQVLRNGEHSGAFPGRFVRRAGWQNQCSLQDIKPANRGI